MIFTKIGSYVSTSRNTDLKFTEFTDYGELHRERIDEEEDRLVNNPISLEIESIKLNMFEQV